MKLPGSAAEIAAVIGDDRALFLIGRLPRCIAGANGKKSERVILYVPTEARFKPDHQLVTILGWNDALKLVRAFGGEVLCPANCNGIYRPFRDAGIRRLVAEGKDRHEVAEWFGVTYRHVCLVTAENPQEEAKAANDNNAPVNLKRA